MPFSSPSVRALLFSAVLCSLSYAPAQTATSQDGSTTPKGKVLFEKHDAPVTDTAPQVDSTAPEETPKRDASGVSSSTRRSRTTLKRRSAADTSAPGETDPPQLERESAMKASSSSVAPEEGLTGGPITLTAADAQAASQITAANRQAVHIDSIALDLHLNTHTGNAEARAQLLVRNVSDEPLQAIPLQISGALHWESVRLAGVAAPLALEQHHLSNDLDHTGYATELAAMLPQPLAPGASASLDLYYAGTLAASTQRLTAMGAPEGRATLTDWDTVTDSFTGLRGLGDVLWYPTAGSPALLRDGNRVAEAVEAARQSDSSIRFALQLTLEYTGSRPAEAFFCGDRQPLTSLAAGAEKAESGFVEARWTREKLGLHTPSLFVTTAASQPGTDGVLRVSSNQAGVAAATQEAGERVRPMLTEWLGAVPARPLNVIDLPIAGAAGFADGALLVAPLDTAASGNLASVLVQPLTAAWLPPGVGAQWIRDGLPFFLQAVWTERVRGRESALAGMAAGLHSAIAADPEKPAVSSSQASGVAAAPACADVLCSRVRGAYIFEMLRSMLGDSALQQAISGWAVQQTTAREHSAAVETSAMEALLRQVAGKRDLQWFFQSWLQADAGLPELSILTVAPRRVERAAPAIYLPQARKPVAGPIGAEPVAPTDPRDMNEHDQAALAAAEGSGAGAKPGSWLVAVEVQNSGGADAEVPVTVRNGSLTNTLPLHVAAHSRATIRVPFEAEPEEVLVNDGSVPEAKTVQHRRLLKNLPGR